MDITAISSNLVQLIGGKENLVSAMHCATRLRIVLVDDSQVDCQEIEKLEGVKRCLISGGQLQIIFGTGVVNNVYAEFAKIVGLDNANNENSPKAQQGQKRENIELSKFNPLQKLARILSSIFVPILPAIVSAGLFIGVLNVIKQFGFYDAQNLWCVILQLCASAAFVILPILIGFSCAREFGGNTYLGAVMGAILTHPLLHSGAMAESPIQIFSLLNYDIGLVSYQGTVFPVLLSVWVMSWFEKQIRQLVPNALELLLTPLLTLFITVSLAFFILAPVGRLLGESINYLLTLLLTYGSWISGAALGGTYSMIVLTGVHHSFLAIETGLLTDPAIATNYFAPIWAMSNTAQAGACLAVYFKTNDTKIKALTVPSCVSAMLGFTEAAMFGINLRLVKPFIAALIGGAVGGAFVVFMRVEMTALALGGIPGIAIVPISAMLNYIIGLLLAFASAFILTLCLKQTVTN